MAIVKVGDLVCMHRRKKKGMGIVLQQINNIGQAAGIKDTDGTIEALFSLKNPRERRTYRTTIIEQADKKDMAELFLTYNGHEWCRKRKDHFVRVRWFETPSEYETKTMTKDEAWIPAEWLRKL